MQIDWMHIARRILQRPAWCCAPPGSPVRRDAAMLYVFMIAAGASSGVILTNPALGLMPDGDGTTAVLIGAAGVLTGWLTAYWLEERYTTAFNAWPWLALSAVQLVAAPLILLAVGAVLGTVLAVIAAIVGGVILLIALPFIILRSFDR